MEASGGQKFKKPRPHPDDVQRDVAEAPVERDDVRVLTNRCPFCHVDLDVDNERWTACARCFARHHDACWTESGACGSCGETKRLAPVREAQGLTPTPTVVPTTLGGRLTAWASRNAVQLIMMACAMTILLAFGIAFLSGPAGQPAPLLMAIGLGLAFGSPLIVYGVYKTRMRKRAQREATEASQDAREGWQSFPVRYCSEKRFRSWWKMYPWEETGVLSLSDGGVTLTTKTPSGGTIERRFQNEDATLHWEGQDFLRNGALHWFAIEQDGERVYFTSETGSTVFGSEDSTRAIYDRLLAR